MVKKTKARLDKYSAGIDPINVYLKVKKYKFIPLKPITLHSMKDEFFETLKSEYELDARQLLLSQEAWKELYWLGYNTLQKMKKEE
jgi:hypothetical protein